MMKITFEQIKPTDFETVLELFKITAQKIAAKNVDHWQYWLNPPIEKVNWVKAGIEQNEFFFLKNDQDELIGMVRILEEDELYWGKQADSALYVHSLVIIEKFNGQGIAELVFDLIEEKARLEHKTFLRFDADIKNPKLCAYYEGLGFQKVGISKQKISDYQLFQKAV